MAGITRYAHKQEALDGRIDEARHEFAALNAAEPKDFDRIDALEEEIDWSTRIFQDRQQSLTYVCETPVILEQRAFALGRAIAALLPGVGGGRRARRNLGREKSRSHSAALRPNILRRCTGRNPVDAGEAFRGTTSCRGRPPATWRACGPDIRSATC